MLHVAIVPSNVSNMKKEKKVGDQETQTGTVLEYEGVGKICELKA